MQQSCLINTSFIANSVGLNSRGRRTQLKMLPRSEFSFDSCETNDVDPCAPSLDQPEQLFHYNLTLGIEKKLREKKMIKDVKMIIRKSVDKLHLNSWERKHCLSLPKDLYDYYLSTNGFRLVWNLEQAGETMRVGDMCVNPITQVVPIDYIKANDSAAGGSLSKNDPKNDPYFHMRYTELQQIIASTKTSTSQYCENISLGSQGKAFRLDANRSGWGTVCLVYPKGNASAAENKSGSNSKLKAPKTDQGPSLPSPKRIKSPPLVEIWFMDPSCQWHFLAPTFTHYYRMLLFHLGMPQWQYRFTPFGLSAWAEHLFWIVAPHILQPPKISYFPNLYSGLWSTDFPAEAATPNTTNNIITSNLFRKKKKNENKPQE